MVSVPKQWAIRDVPKATFIDLQTGKPLVYLTDLKTSGISNSAETVYAQGGTGNPRIVGFSSGRTASINLENAVFDNIAIAMMTGNELIKGTKEIYYREVLTVASNKVTLTKTPTSTGELVGLFKEGVDGSHEEEFEYTDDTVSTGEYKVLGKSVTFFSGDLDDGERVIAYYNVNTDANAETITISSDKFAGSFKLVLDCIVKSTYDKQDYLAQIIIPTCKMEDDWEISMAADGDPSTHTMPIEILKPSFGTEMYTMTIFSGDSLV